MTEPAEAVVNIATILGIAAVVPPVVPSFCPGCGYYRVTVGIHRADCTRRRAHG